MEAAIWILVVVLMLIGLAGTFLPVLPGAPIIFLAAVLHKYFLPGYLTGWSLAGMALLATIAVFLDMACSLGGAKWYGATSWGIFGSALGALVGLWFGPLGLLLGAVGGAFLGEILFSRKTLKDAARAGIGAGLGLLASTLGRAAICLLMIAAFAVDCLI